VEAAALLAPPLDLVVDQHRLLLGVHHAAAVPPEVGFLARQRLAAAVDLQSSVAVSSVLSQSSDVQA